MTYPWSGRNAGKTAWRTEPTSVENGVDELGIEVKCQSNLEIAGSPRNVFRYSVVDESGAGRALNGLGAITSLPNPTKLRMAAHHPAAVRLWGLSSMVERETAQTTG